MKVIGQNLVGRRVREIRMKAGLTQEALAARCQTQGWDISRGTFSKIEAGLRRVNDAEVVILARTLRCTVADLMEGFTIKAVIAVVRNSESAN
ncbi:MAG: helix-turn-helix transcriptional regulator [Verrucomicrobiota bacterium]